MRIIFLLVILAIAMFLTSCAHSGIGRIGSTRLSGNDLRKAAPACVWNGNCPQAKGMFNQLAKVK